MAEKKRAILADPVANLDVEGGLVRLHCGTPGELCNLDDAKRKETVTWLGALSLCWRSSLPDRQLLCQFCFGGEGE